MSQKTKINKPFVFINSFLNVVNFGLYHVFDYTWVWIENRLSNSTEISCDLTANTTSCAHITFSMFGVYCSPLMCFCSAGFLLLFNFVGLVSYARTFHKAATSFMHVTKTQAGKKDMLADNKFYVFSDALMKLAILVDIPVRFLRHTQNLAIPMYFDNLTLFAVYTVTILNILYNIQLSENFGFIAIVLKLMLWDCFCFFLLFGAFMTPYNVLFRRVINYKVPTDQCESTWSTEFTAHYSIFLLLLNAITFEDRVYHDTNEGRSIELYVST